jgi:hypothetical protein
MTAIIALHSEPEPERGDAENGVGERPWFHFLPLFLVRSGPRQSIDLMP